MKKVLSVFLSVLMLLSCSLFSFAEEKTADDFTVTIGSKSAFLGETVTLPVTVNTSKGLNGFQFQLTYDETALSYVNSEIPLANTENSAINPSKGAVEFLWTDLTGVPAGSTVIANITFKVLKEGTLPVTLVKNPEMRPGDCFYYVADTTMTDYSYSQQVGNVLSDKVVYPLGVESVSAGLSDTSVTVPVKIKSAKNLYGFALEVQYNPQDLTFNKGVLTDAVPYGFAVSHTPGIVRVSACTEVAAPLNGDVVLAYLTFDIVNTALKEFPLNVSFYNNQPAYTLDENKNTVNVSCSPMNGTITLAGMENDVNGDNTCDIGDVTALLNYLSDPTAFPASGETDINGDNNTDIQDVTVLLNVLASL